MENYKLEKLQKFLKAYIKMEKIIIKFGDIEIKKQIFYQHKKRISVQNIDINKIVVSNNVSFGKKGFKCFNVSLNVSKCFIRPLCIFLPKMGTYRWKFDKLNICLFW